MVEEEVNEDNQIFTMNNKRLSAFDLTRDFSLYRGQC